MVILIEDSRILLREKWEIENLWLRFMICGTMYTLKLKVRLQIPKKKVILSQIFYTESTI